MVSVDISLVDSLRAKLLELNVLLQKENLTEDERFEIEDKKKSIVADLLDLLSQVNNL